MAAAAVIGVAAAAAAAAAARRPARSTPRNCRHATVSAKFARDWRSCAVAAVTTPPTPTGCGCCLRARACLWIIAAADMLASVAEVCGPEFVRRNGLETALMSRVSEVVASRRFG
jgi:hypothetical protein